MFASGAVLFRDPVLTALTAFSVFLVLGLILSAWVEKRRDERVREWARLARDQNRGRRPDTVSKPGYSRFFKTRYLLLALIGIAGLAMLQPSDKSPAIVHARTAPAAAPGTIARSESAPVPAQTEVRLWWNDFANPNRLADNTYTRSSLWENGSGKLSARISLSDPLEVRTDPQGLDHGLKKTVRSGINKSRYPDPFQRMEFELP